MKKQSGVPAARAQLRTGGAHPYTELSGWTPLGGGETAIYTQLRQAVPLLDAAILKLVRLTGGFTVRTSVPDAARPLRHFLDTVPVGRGQRGISSFLEAYLGSLLTYGRAVGEMIVSQGRLVAVAWGDVRRLEVREGASPLDFTLCAPDRTGRIAPLPYPELLLFTTLHPEPGSPYGVSILRGLPFLSDILMQIYKTVGQNWERAGNVRYSVVCRPDGGTLDTATARARAESIAEEWSRAMQESRAGMVRDFVAVGDVEIKVIGADAQVLSCETPVRQILEQLVAKTGLPPFLLGLSWSATERMASQQADLLTSELWSLRRSVEPALLQVCDLWLRLNGFGGEAEIVWDEISLQDIVDESHAALYRAQAAHLTKEDTP